jgi:glutathione S-transferase
VNGIVEMTYRLYYAPGACSMAPHIALEEIGAPYKAVAVSLRNGEHQSADYLSVNPKGFVPALAVDGTRRVLTEAPAILIHLALRHPEAGLLPEDPWAEARCFEWLAWLSNWLHATGFSALWRPERFTVDEAARRAVAEAGREIVRSAFAAIEGRLAAKGDAPWCIAGAGFGVADAFLLVFYRWGGRLGLDMRFLYPMWTGLAERTVERPAVRRVLAREGVEVWRTAKPTT